MEPWMSWVLFGTAASGIGVYYYTESRKKIARARDVAGRRRGSSARVDSKDRRTKGKDSGSSDHVASDSADVPSVTGNGAGAAKKRKGNKKQPSKLAQSSAVQVSDEPSARAEEPEDEGMSNTDFARQFSSKQAGTDLKRPAGPLEKQKSKKQGKHNKTALEATSGSASTPDGTPTLQQPSTASSTTGADADDDLSPANSPELGATSNTTPSGADVSDMLEAPAKGPSILNITAPTNPQPARQPKQQKPVQEPETKKQRQNRRKKEEQRAAREEDEKERRILLEKQLRTAREAEGRPAKNGLGISGAPLSNAWSKTAAINGSLRASPATGQNDEPLLDTFDDSQSPANGMASLGASKVNGDPSPQDNSTSTFTPNTDIPSEEEQLRIISELDSDNAWVSVNKGGKSRKNKAAPSTTQVSGNAANKSEFQKSASKFAGLHVEHSTEDSTSMDVEEVAAVAQPENSPDNDAPSDVKEGTSKEKEGGALSGGMDGTPETNTREQYSTIIPTTDISSNTSAPRKSITGLTIPAFVHPSPHEAWITKETPESKLPQGWFHYDNGCKLGNAKIPSRDNNYESEIHKHTRFAPDGQLYPLEHRMKANAEKDAYDMCFHVYRAHIARTLDRKKWNKDNIKHHPAYEPDWPWALIPHPQEAWSAGFHDAKRDCSVCEAYSR